ncbi:MAG: glycosyltransferase family 4 protein [Planctomycetota bacterium]
MRLLHVAHAFPPESYAGVEVHTLGVARELRARGHEVAVLHRSSGDEPWGLTESHVEDLLTFRLDNPLPYDSIDTSFHEPRVEHAFREAIDRFRPDLVHFQHLIHLSAHLPAVTDELGIPSLLTFHDYWYLCSRVQIYRPDDGRCAGPKILRCARCLGGIVHVPPWMEVPAEWVGKRRGWTPARIERLGEPTLLGHVVRRRERMIEWLSKPALLIANSHHLRSRYLEALPIPPERIRMVRYGLDPAPFEDLPSRTDSPVLRLGYTGSLVEHKGLHVLIEAIRDLPGVTLDIFGADRGDPAVEAYAASLPRTDAIRFLGGYRQHEVGRLLRTIDVLVVPSIWEEAWGLIADEAFLAGVPVLASRIGGLPEHVFDGHNGLLFHVGDAQDLRRQIRWLIAKPERIDRLRAGIGEVRTLADNTGELEELYRQAIAGDLRPPPQPSLWTTIRERLAEKRRSASVRDTGDDSAAT